MSLFRIRLCLKGPLGTPLTSGTMFGHLCWAKREAAGEAALTAWLAALPEAPWALSDGFSADCLPFPLLPPPPRDRPKEINVDMLIRLRERKKKAKQQWISLAAWKRHRSTCHAGALYGEGTPAVAAGTLAAVRIAHNTIDRHTGSTPDEGGLFFVDEDWRFAAQPLCDIYLRAEAGDAEVHSLFAAVGEAGYGRDATYGRGHFTVEAVEDASWLDDLPGTGGGRRMLSLSQGCLTPNMADPRYKLFTLFGKVGFAMLGDGVRPWKKPLLLTRAGCTFRPADAGPFGAWLTGVHQDLPAVGHNAFHLAIPYREAELQP